MATAEVGSLRISLGMNAGELRTGAREAESVMDQLSRNIGISASTIQRIGIATAAALATMAAAFVVGFKTALDSADELNKLSQKMGLTVEELAGLKYAADLSDVSLQELGKAVRTLSVNMQEIASGNKTSEAARALAAMGISATDASGRLRNVRDVIAEVADRFAGYTDGAGKAALASAVFGKSGTDLIPLLNQGSQGLREAQQEAERFGLTISGPAAQAAEALKDNLTKLGAIVQGSFLKVVTQLAQPLANLTSNMIDLAEKFHGADVIIRAATVTLTALEDVMSRAGILASAAGQQIAAFGALVGNAFSGNWSEGLKAYEAAQNAIIESTRAKLTDLKTLWEPASTWITTMEDNVKKSAPPIVQGVQQITEAQREFNKSVADGVQLVKALETPTEALGRKLDNLGDAYSAGKISAEQMGVAQQAAAYAAQNAYASMASNVAGALTQVFSHNKAVAIAAALINTYEAVTKALATYPPPFSYVAAGAALAAGLAQVNKIRSTSKNSSGGGGGSVGGGSTGTQAANAPGVTQAININLHGDNFSGDGIVSLADQLNKASKDGKIQLVVNRR